MSDEGHLSEAMLNMYLDGELSAGERDRVAAHLAACEACRAEMLALQRLFTALQDLAPALAPDLVPGVLARIQPRRLRVRPRSLWLVPALQAAAALALLAWGWTRLVGCWAVVSDVLSPGTLADVWADVSGWMAAQWATLPAWPNTAWAEVQEWAAQLPTFGAMPLSLTQLTVLGVALAVLWLVGNVVLLRRALLNGQVMQRRY